jgi:hypothetical protein
MTDNVSNRLDVQAVAGQRLHAEQTLANTVGAGISFNGTALDHGFTEYIESREAERFFGS